MVHVHKQRYNDFIKQTPRTVRHRAMKTMSSITEMIPVQNIWLQDVKEAYIPRRDLQRNVYVKGVENPI